MTLWTHKRSLAVLGLVSLGALSACGSDSQDNSSEPVVRLLTVPPVPPPPGPPFETVGEIQFTLDNSITVSQDVPFAGGELVLEVPGGARFTISVPNGAFFAETNNVTMRSIVHTQGLPPGLTPIATVNLGPSGADFAVQPVLEIDLRTLSRPTGNVVIFLANDDGTGLTYLLPEADDIVEAVLSDGSYRARVPHFSGVGIAVSDPNGPGIPDAAIADSAEIKARQSLNKIIEEQARGIIMGQRMLGESVAGLEPIVSDWLDDIDRRANELTESSEIDEVEKITKELFRFLETERTLKFSSGMPKLEETAIGAVIVHTLAMQVDLWNDRCIAGNANAVQRIRERIIFLGKLFSVGLLSARTYNSINRADFCLSDGT